MIKSGNLFIQLYALISGLILIIFSLLKRDPILFVIGIIIIIRDGDLLVKKENCYETNQISVDFKIRSGNKLMQFLAVLSGFYISFRYWNVLLLNLIGLSYIFGDGYLLLFEHAKKCE